MVMSDLALSLDNSPRPIASIGPFSFRNIRNMRLCARARCSLTDILFLLTLFSSCGGPLLSSLFKAAYGKQAIIPWISNETNSVARFASVLRRRSGTVTLSAPAYSGGINVSLTSSNTSVAAVQSNITIPAGATRGTFSVTTVPVSSSTPVTITASSGVPIKSATLTVTPPSLYSLSVVPATVVGGNSSTGTVKLNGVAPSGGISVSLASSNPSVATAPSTVTIPVGATNATFSIQTVPVSTTASAAITATMGQITKISTLTVTPHP
jgi:hypothetical protein